MFKQRKNKTFNYQSRFSKEDTLDSKAEITNEKDFISKWKPSSKRKIKTAMSMQTLILVLVLLLICMYLLNTKIIQT